MTTTTRRRDGSWSSEDQFDLGGTRQLRLSTFRSQRGLLITTATVCNVSDGMMTWAIGSDFSERILTSQPGRVTAAICEAQQKQALADIETIKARALAHYAPQAA